ncbi:MAG TPA: hypothetical protein VF746_32135 [Longimicrobium sp.]|jgi:hypothetical protein
MRKFRLDVEDLRVDTFATTPEPARGAGTVDAFATGQVGTCFDPSCRPRLCPQETVEATCPATCYNTCPNTCANTCDDPTCANTCAYTCDDATCIDCGSGSPSCWDSCTCPLTP